MWLGVETYLWCRKQCVGQTEDQVTAVSAKALQVVLGLSLSSVTRARSTVEPKGQAATCGDAQAPEDSARG